MQCIVQKYGGSSVADAGRIKQVASRIAETDSGWEVSGEGGTFSTPIPVSCVNGTAVVVEDLFR